MRHNVKCKIKRMVINVTNLAKTIILHFPLCPPQMVFDAPGGDDFIFTTESHVIPEGFPYDECTTAEECNGVLV